MVSPKKKIRSLKGFTKHLLIGRDVQFFDKVIFYSSGWLIGNKIRARDHGKSKKVSEEKLIFIGGYPRSGTSLLKVLVEQHPKVIGPKTEIHVFQDVRDKEKVKEEFEFSEREMEEIDFQEKDLVKVTEEIVAVFRKKNKSGKDVRVLFKIPKNLFFIEKIFKHYPKSKFIHIIRDPRDATMSQKYFLLPPWKKSWPYEWCCRQYEVFMNKGKKFREDPRYMELKYEELIENPVDEMNVIFDFLELEPINKNKIKNYFKSKTAKKFYTHPRVSKPIDKKMKNKWVNKMSGRDKRVFDKILGKTFKELGYRKHNNS